MRGRASTGRRSADPPRGRRRGRAGAGDVGRAGQQEREVARDRSRASGIRAPSSGATASAPASAVSGQPNPELKVGLYGDIASVDDATAHRWLVMCFDKSTGKPLWERTAHTGVPKVKRHPKSTHANSTLATDGRHRRVLRLRGALRLRPERQAALEEGLRRCSTPASSWCPTRSGASPARRSSTTTRVIVQADVQKGSFLAAFDLADRQGAVAHAAQRRADVEHARPCTSKTAARRSSSTAGSTSAATTSRPARSSGG